MNEVPDPRASSVPAATAEKVVGSVASRYTDVGVVAVVWPPPANRSSVAPTTAHGGDWSRYGDSVNWTTPRYVLGFWPPVLPVSTWWSLMPFAVVTV